MRMAGVKGGQVSLPRVAVDVNIIPDNARLTFSVENYRLYLYISYSWREYK